MEILPERVTWMALYNAVTSKRRMHLWPLISVWFTKRVWFVGCTCCTPQTLYAWLVRGLYVCMVGILIYKVLHLSLRCDSWYATMLLI